MAMANDGLAGITKVQNKYGVAQSSDSHYIIVEVQQYMYK